MLAISTWDGGSQIIKLLLLNHSYLVLLDSTLCASLWSLLAPDSVQVPAPVEYQVLRLMSTSEIAGSLCNTGVSFKAPSKMWKSEELVLLLTDIGQKENYFTSTALRRWFQLFAVLTTKANSWKMKAWFFFFWISTFLFKCNFASAFRYPNWSYLD